MIITNQGEICKAILRLFNKQFKDDHNTFTDASVNERHFFGVFVCPLFEEIFDDISKWVISLKWGEYKLRCAKVNEHNALADSHRRTPGPSIDGVFTLPRLTNIEFVVMELFGGPTADDFEHLLGDRNKLAKNLKLMLKHVISLHVNKYHSGVSSLKLFGLQIYKNEVFVYSITSPLKNQYMFELHNKFNLPTSLGLLPQTFPQFMGDIWILKRTLIASYKTIEMFLLEEGNTSEDDAASDFHHDYIEYYCYCQMWFEVVDV